MGKSSVKVVESILKSEAALEMGSLIGTNIQLPSWRESLHSPSASLGQLDDGEYILAEDIEGSGCFFGIESALHQGKLVFDALDNFW